MQERTATGVDVREPTPPRGFWAKVRKTAGTVPFIHDALAAYYCATDPATPPHVKAALVGALAYFVAPIDLIPDVVAGLGFVDDAAVLGAVLATVQKHMKPGHYTRARAWLDGRDQGDKAA